MKQKITILIIILAPVLFIIFWCFVVGLISLTGGWVYLAAKYKVPESLKPEIKIFKYQTVFLNFMTRYKHVITVKIYDEGIYLRPIALYYFLHKPIFIKWSSIKSIECKDTFFKHITLHFDDKKIQITGESANFINAKFKKE